MALIEVFAEGLALLSVLFARHLNNETASIKVDQQPIYDSTEVTCRQTLYLHSKRAAVIARCLQQDPQLSVKRSRWSEKKCS